MALVYVAVARLGLHFATVTHAVTLVWPPSGIALAALLLLGRRHWPGVALGAFVANAVTPGESLPLAALIAVGNTLEALAGATFLRRAHFQSPLARLTDVLALATLGGVASTTFSATFGTVGLGLSGLLPTGAWLETWRTWWLGDLMGDLIIAPLVLTLATGSWTRPSVSRALELVALLVALGVASGAAFTGSRGPDGGTDFPKPYVIFPLLIWAALRFGPRGAAGANFVVSAISLVATIAGTGPFSRLPLNESLFQLQTFMAVAVLTSLFLGAAIAERNRALTLRDDFLAVASHELNTPLMALQLDMGSLGRMAGQETSARESLAKGISHAERQVKRLSELVRLLLDSAQFAAGGFTLHVVPTDLVTLARQVADRFTPSLGDAGRAIKVQAPLELVGLWDPVRLELVITNLVANAVKYGQDKPIELNIIAIERGATFQVRDFGIGIPQGAQGRVFERFERAVSNQSYPGLGLGLWITRSIVAAMQGTIEVTSEVGAGATFTVTLPRGTGSPADEAP